MNMLVPPPHARRARCLAVGDPGTVAAAARGGGLGVLDGAGPAALRVVAARVKVPYGVRTDAELPSGTGAAFVVRTQAPWWGDRPVLAEVDDPRVAAEAVAGGAAGLVARGAGEISGFVLLQKLLEMFEVPVWGWVPGVRTAVGALAGGAAGVVLAAEPAQRVPGTQAPPGPVTGAGGTEALVRRVLGAGRPEVRPGGPGGPLLRTFGCALPVAQGPMTRVSDQPGFAAAVAAEGGFPFVAVAMATGTGTADLLARTATRLGDRPWGAGLLGFVPDELRTEQLEAVRRARPRCVLVAGGRPGQAKSLEAEGLATFLHVPSPILLRQYLDAGVRRFVFEGAECGGHVGPSSSFALWERQLEVLGDAGDVEVLFAGGVHDARSAAMVAAMAQPLAAAGSGVGVLMGTAYLFTREAVEHGAITGLFQDQALAASSTVTLETAPGHVTRCLPSPYAAEFASVKAGLSGIAPQEAWSRLEELNTGRLRIASKGLRREGAHLAEVDADGQLAQGLFMAGQVAVLRSERTTIAALHRAVTEEAAGFARAVGPDGAERGGSAAATGTGDGESGAAAADPDRDVAIIGMAGAFPGAPDLAAFWSNVLRGEDSVTEVPPGRWDPEVYFGQSASKWGGFLPGLAVDPLAFGIPPKAMGSIDPAQLVSLEVATRALADAGYADRPFDRAGTSVVFGAEAGGDLANAGTLRSLLAGYFEEVPAELLDQLPAPTEDTFPGTLANVISGRIANRLDLGGANFTVDAACGSSLAALDAAVKELRAGTSSLVLCGAVDLHNGVHDYLMFTSAGALSPTGKCRPFDSAADGIALGEGVACLVLKRLSDAERDGDRIYAVVKGVGAASDGRALGLTAPRPDGQHRALARAYHDARVSPADVGLVEAHGTGTAVGDATELRTLTGFFTGAGAEPGACALGSVKSQIGHTKCAAGLAGLIKAALALWHEALPPTLHLTRPNAEWDAATSPFSFTTAARPWPSPARFAGVSAFGFGGTNYHAVLAAGPVAPDRAHGLRDWPPEAEELVAAIRHARAETGPRASAGEPGEGPGRVAFLFPGQGSQRPGMLGELMVCFPELAEVLRLAPEVAAVAFPPHAFSPEAGQRQEDELTDTRFAQPALGLVEFALTRLLERFGVRPDLLAGHSYGELAALAAGGAFGLDALLRLSRARGRLMAEAAGLSEPGGMAAVAAAPAALTPDLLGPDVVVANDNGPHQVVLSGPVSALEDTVRRVREHGFSARRLPVACAFHSPLVAGAAGQFALRLAEESIVDPQRPVWANRTARPYDGDVRAELAAQLVSPVRFADQIEDMYAAGARTFVEVGPGRVLTGLTGQILDGRPHTAVACGPDLRGFLTALRALAEAGVPVEDAELTRGRERPVVSATAWTVDGRSVRAPGAAEPALPVARRIRTARPPGSAPATPPLLSAPGALAAQAGGPEAGPVPPSDRRTGAVADFLRTTRELVAAQREVLLGYLGATVPAAPPAPVPLGVAEPAPAPAKPRAAAAEPQPVLSTVLGVISDRTGYPRAMITADLDLEADLSIDSIKRTEIAGTLLSALGLPADDRTDRLSRDRTAQALASHLEELLTPAAAAPVRYRIGRTPVPLEPGTDGVRGKTVAIRSEPGQEELAAAVRTLFAEAGGEVLDLGPDDQAAAGGPGAGPAPGHPGTDPDGTDPDGTDPDSTDPDGADPDGTDTGGIGAGGIGAEGTDAEDADADGTEPEGIDTSGADPDDTDSAGTDPEGTGTAAAGPDLTVSLSALRGPGRSLAPELFELLKTTPGAVVIAAAPGTTSAAGLRGLVRAAALERTVTTRLVEVTQDVPKTLLDEALSAGPAVVAHERDGRYTFVPRPEELGPLAFSGAGPGGGELAALGLGPDSVVLMIGGARGVAAHTAVALAASGCRVELAGRTPWPAEPGDPDESADPAGLRTALAGQGLPIREIEHRVRAAAARKEIGRTLDAVRAAGGQPGYHALDVRDPAAVRALVRRLAEHHGRLDGVVHAAGVLDDKLMREKDKAAFATVFETKVDGAEAVLDALTEAGVEPGFVVFFGSVAGVLGNRGQTDYAAANDALETLSGRWPGRALTVHWGPWAPLGDHPGMVTPELARHYREREIGLLDPAEATAALLRELAYGTAGVVVYTASLW
ncbi:SDR family NAD(P)-dependent oxidoreductase [Amycolatopsis sp. PS_44_ISF1]|uniref:SDR family NAD(P)-dependent oxidoreductase n=1 Tax=Amycolatopsis sp. PS_44_ISF1 TaxID=2974917 RepID=UPI0028DE3A5C|nr:SDR family NAD(P)-dependent oxidoreductase [Amycolatopsis sp. PS_44_ISF1]MDT8912982.1 SDR family oxidoreductase [Amycolatopsis sp. PS_44_ISF1]